MMTLVYDLSPDQFDLTSASLKKQLGRDAANFLRSYQEGVAKEFAELGKPSEYSIGIEYKLVLTKKPGEADIVLSQGSSGAGAVVVIVPKDPGKSHPYRQKELVAAVNKEFSGAATINQHDIQCVNKVHEVKKRGDWFYQGTVKGSPVQYSDSFKGWLVERFRQDSEFFKNARKKVSRK